MKTTVSFSARARCWSTWPAWMGAACTTARLDRRSMPSQYNRSGLGCWSASSRSRARTASCPRKSSSSRSARGFGSSSSCVPPVCSIKARSRAERTVSAALRTAAASSGSARVPPSSRTFSSRDDRVPASGCSCLITLRSCSNRSERSRLRRWLDSLRPASSGPQAARYQVSVPSRLSSSSSSPTKTVSVSTAASSSWWASSITTC